MKLKMKKYIYILLFVAMPFGVLAQTADENPEKTTVVTKESGDIAYSEERYQDAIAIYEELLALNGPSIEIHYNLGNAYFRNNMVGEAILNYERALKIDPTDEESKFNLSFAQNYIKDEIPVNDDVFFVRWIKEFVNMAGITTWSVIAVVSFVLMLIAITIFFVCKGSVMRKITLTTFFVTLLMTIVANLSAKHIYSLMNDDSYAIVMNEEVNMKSSPDASGTILLKMHEGRKVRIIDDSLKEWVEVEVDNGKLIVGWVPVQTIERI